MRWRVVSVHCPFLHVFGSFHEITECEIVLIDGKRVWAQTLHCKEPFINCNIHIYMCTVFPLTLSQCHMYSYMWQGAPIASPDMCLPETGTTCTWFHVCVKASYHIVTHVCVRVCVRACVRACVCVCQWFSQNVAACVCANACASHCHMFMWQGPHITICYACMCQWFCLTLPRVYVIRASHNIALCVCANGSASHCHMCLIQGPHITLLCVYVPMVLSHIATCLCDKGLT